MSSDFRVPVSSCPLLMDVPFVLCLFLLGGAIGHSVLRRLRASTADLSRLEYGVFAGAIGVGLLQYLFFGLGIAGYATPRAIWGGLIVLLVLFGRGMLAVVRDIAASLRRLRAAPVTGWIRLVVAIAAITLAIQLLYALSPPTDYDGQMYHLTAPKRWLQLGRMAYLPSFPMTLWPMGIEMLYGTAMAVWSDTAAKLIHYAFGVLTLLGTYHLGRRLGGAVVGALALGAFIAQWFFLLGWAYVDLGIALETICAVLAWSVWFSGRGRSWLLVAGLCAGLSGSFKLTGIILGVILAVASLVEMRRSGDDPRSMRMTLLCFLLLALLPVVPWLMRAWILTGNPVYPLLNHVFPTRGWNPRADHGFRMNYRYFNWAHDRAGWNLVFRRRLIAGCQLGTALAALFYVLLVRRRDLRTLAVIGCVLIVVFLSQLGLSPRYFVPLMPLLWVLALAPHASRLERAKWGPRFVVLFHILVALYVLRDTAPSLRLTAGAAAGTISRRAYLEARMPAVAAWWYVNERLPKGARILSTVETTYYCDRYCYVAFAYQGAIRLGRWQDTLADTRRERIDYLLLWPREAAVPGREPDSHVWASNSATACHDLSDRFGVLLTDVCGNRLFRMVEPAARP